MADNVILMMICCYVVACSANLPMSGQYTSLTVEPIRDEVNDQILFNVSWVPGVPEPVYTQLTIEPKVTLRRGRFENASDMIIIPNEGAENYITSSDYHILANWEYTVKICGKPTNGPECGPERIEIIKTPVLKPEPIGIVTAKTSPYSKNYKMTLTFTCPDKPRDTVIGFVVRKMTLKTANESSSHESMDDFYVPKANACKLYNKNRGEVNSDAFGGVEVLKNYAFYVMVVGGEFNSTWNEKVFYTADARVPMPGGNSLIKHVSSSKDTLTIQICSSCALNGELGPITEVGLLVCVISRCYFPIFYSPATHQEMYSISEHQVMWAQAKDQDFTKAYWVTPQNWIDDLKKNTTEQYEYTIGSDKNCSTNTSVIEFCNGPLPENEEFEIMLVVCNSAGCGQYETGNYLEHTFKTTGDDDDDGLSDGEIAGIVIGVLCGVAILGAIAFFVFKKARGNNYQV